MSSMPELPLELVVAIWKLGQSELNREGGKSLSKSEEMIIMRVARAAKEWVRSEREKVNVTLTNGALENEIREVKSLESHVRFNPVRPGEYRKVYGK